MGLAPMNVERTRGMVFNEIKNAYIPEETSTFMVYSVQIVEEVIRNGFVRRVVHSRAD